MVCFGKKSRSELERKILSREVGYGLGNLLVVGTEARQLAHNDIQAIMLRLQQRAEKAETSVVHRYGFRDRADFFNRYQRLSAVLVRKVPLPAGGAVILWNNPQAKYPLPAKVGSKLSRSHTL